MPPKTIYTPADQAADAKRGSQFVQALNTRTQNARWEHEAQIARPRHDAVEETRSLPSQADHTAMREAERTEVREAQPLVEDATRGNVVDADA
ncbi:MAG: hypothetical protein AB7E47_18035 [Desulfovibrionaceae bacterium]